MSSLPLISHVIVTIKSFHFAIFFGVFFLRTYIPLSLCSTLMVIDGVQIRLSMQEKTLLTLSLE